MNDILREISLCGIVPVVKIDNASDAIPLARALLRGGLPVAEITFRTACAPEAIAAITSEFPDMLTGAGTVLTCRQAELAIKAGAKFIVSPGLNPNVVKYVQSCGVLMIPGVSSPSDIEAALELGLTTLKFFPAEAAGGLAMLKAMAAPYSEVKFMPTGGINEANLLEYMTFPKVIACGGSYMVKDTDIKEGNFGKIEALTRSAVLKMLGFRIESISTEPENDAYLCSLFGFESVEAKKSDDNKGNIIISTNFLERAMAYLKRMNVELTSESEHGFYLKQKIQKFTVQISEIFAQKK